MVRHIPNLDLFWVPRMGAIQFWPCYCCLHIPLQEVYANRGVVDMIREDYPIAMDNAVYDCLANQQVGVHFVG